MAPAEFWLGSESLARTCHTESVEQRTDRLTATYVDLAVNVVIAFELAAGMRVHSTKRL